MRLGSLFFSLLVCIESIWAYSAKDLSFEEVIRTVYEDVKSQDDQDTQASLRYLTPDDDRDLEDYKRGHTLSAWNVLQRTHNIAGSHIFDILPRGKFHVARQKDYSLLKDLIDQSSISIFKTPTGKLICGKFSEGMAINLSSLGLTAKTIQKIRSECVQWSWRVSKLPKGITEPGYDWTDKYNFIFFEDDNFYFHGWTDIIHDSYISININDPSYESFLRSLTHEIYQTVDIKSQAQFSGDILKKYNGPNTCLVSSVLSNPYVRLAFSSLRSEKIENDVLYEAHVLSEKPQIKNRCTDRVSALIPYMQFFGPILKNEIYNSYSHGVADCFIHFSDLSLDQTLTVLDREEIGTESGSKSLCEYLETPEIGTYSDQTHLGNRFLRKGPRPNIGDGTGIRSLEVKKETGLRPMRPYEQFTKDFKIDMNMHQRKRQLEILNQEYFRNKPAQ